MLSEEDGKDSLSNIDTASHTENVANATKNRSKYFLPGGGAQLETSPMKLASNT